MTPNATAHPRGHTPTRFRQKKLSTKAMSPEQMDQELAKLYQRALKKNELALAVRIKGLQANLLIQERLQARKQKQTLKNLMKETNDKELDVIATLLAEKPEQPPPPAPHPHAPLVYGAMDSPRFFSE